MKHIHISFLALFLLFTGFITSLGAQAIIGNPSFEIAGSGAAIFGGWEQYGVVGSTTTAWHGFTAAKVSGLNISMDNESGFWQQLECDAGEQWQIDGYVQSPASAPLMGSSIARVKVEWFGSGGSFIALESFTVAEASTPQNQYRHFSMLSTPAPAGTIAMRLVPGIWQSQDPPSAVVYYDQISCYSTTYPTVNDVQWDDFPGGRTLVFSDKTWRVKGPGNYGPGPNNFSNQPESVWVDDAGRLHLTIKQISGAWYSTEVTLVDTLGYGDYIFTTLGALNQLDPRTVLGLFLWQYIPTWDPENAWWNPYNEIDIEYSRWGNPANEIGQFVAQPYDWAGNIVRYNASFGSDELSSHAFRWLHDRVEFRAWRGGPEDESPQNLVFSWNYFGPHIPRPEQPRVHLNLWYTGNPPASNQEVILPHFTFIPAGGNTALEDLHIPAPSPYFCYSYPNPFSSRAHIIFELEKAERVKLEIFDLKGRKLSTLVNETKQPGQHTVDWDADNLPNGIYFYKLTAHKHISTGKMILLR